jgi:hypothetical protein
MTCLSAGSIHTVPANFDATLSPLFEGRKLGRGRKSKTIVSRSRKRSRRGLMNSDARRNVEIPTSPSSSPSASVFPSLCRLAARFCRSAARFCSFFGASRSAFDSSSVTRFSSFAARSAESGAPFSLTSFITHP